MNKIEQMLQELCPEGVEYKKLGEVAMLYTGATPNTSIKEYWENGTIPWMSSGEVNNKIITKTEKFITQQGYDSCSTTFVLPEAVVIALAGQGKTRGLVALTKIKLCTNQSLCSIVPSDKLLSSYLYHYLSSKYQHLRKISSGDGTRGGLNLKMISNYEIPIPPLPIQEEIVRILDHFTELTAELQTELQAELQARKEQYEYYRNKLLTFTKIEGTQDVIWMKMSEICGIINAPKKIQKSHYQKTGLYPIIDQGQKYIIGFTNEASALVQAGEYVLFGDHTREIKYVDFPFAQGADGLKIIKPKECINVRFLYHIMLSLKIPNRGYNRHWSVVSPLAIPVPPLSEQQRIVSILDKFETLVNDLSQGLPAEIAAVQEQYEYYRNKLLTFNRIKSN